MGFPRDISPVFVEGLDISAYGITRSVGRHGVPVYALNDKLRDPLRYSKYVRECFVYPDDPAQPRAYAGDSVANEDVLCRLMQEWAARLATGPAFAHAMTKQMIESEVTMAVGEAIEAEAQAQALCMQHPDFAEAHAAFKEKRPPKFEGSP